MTEVLVLTAEDAEKIRGRSPSKSDYILSPRPLKDGRFILGRGALDDPAHEDVHGFLASLPREPLEKLPIYTEADTEPPVMVEAAKLVTRVGRLDASGARIVPEETKDETVRGT